MSIVLLVMALLASAVGLPLPEDAVLVAAGAVRPILTIAVGVPAVVIGDAILYAAGCGVAFRWRRTLPLDRARARIERFGDGAIVIARFVPGIRGAVCLAAGAMRWPLRRFLLVDALAALVHVPLLVLAGGVGRAHPVAAAVALVAVAVIVVGSRIGHSQHESPVADDGNAIDVGVATCRGEGDPAR